MSGQNTTVTNGSDTIIATGGSAISNMSNNAWLGPNTSAGGTCGTSAGSTGTLQTDCTNAGHGGNSGAPGSAGYRTNGIGNGGVGGMSIQKHGSAPNGTGADWLDGQDGGSGQPGQVIISWN